MKLTKQECIFYAVGGIALAYLVVTLTREHMTTQDVQDHQDNHVGGAKDFTYSKTVKHTETDTPIRPANTSKKIKEQKIMGPRAQPVDPNDPSGSGGSNGKKPSSSGVYPEIYGGEYNPVPGHKDSKSSVNPVTGEISSSDPPPYDYVPAAEFPAGPSSPMPYLNDFSNILNYN
jgi:hypothetical protein